MQAKKNEEIQEQAYKMAKLLNIYGIKGTKTNLPTGFRTQGISYHTARFSLKDIH